MKKIILLGVLTAVMLCPAFAMAKKVDMIKVKAKEGYDLIRYEIKTPLAMPDINYYIDPQACICFVSARNESFSIATVDCKKFKKIPELEPHVKECE